MKVVLMDMHGFDSVRKLHEDIAESFGFPEYYGHNLDALYDMLTDIAEDCFIEVIMPAETDDAEALKTQDAAGDGPLGSCACKGSQANEATKLSASERADYARRVMRVLNDAAAVNSHLTVSVLNGSEDDL